MDFIIKTEGRGFEYMILTGILISGWIGQMSSAQISGCIMNERYLIRTCGIGISFHSGLDNLDLCYGQNGHTALENGVHEGKELSI